MIKRANPNIKVVLLSFSLLLLLLFSSCSTTEKIVINEETLLKMESEFTQQLSDREEGLRGNSSSNMRNGGYLIVDGDNLYFTITMAFEDGSESHYLQHLLMSQIGNSSIDYDFVAPLHGVLIGLCNNSLIYIDKEGDSRLIAMDLESYTEKILFDAPVEYAHLIGTNIYLNTIEGDLYELEIDNSCISSEVPHTLLYSNGGSLIGVSEGFAYVLASTEGSSVIRRIDIKQKKVAEKIVGGPFEDVQISGSWFFYKVKETLYRRPLSGGSAKIALYRDVKEYALSSTNILFIEPNGTISMSKLDGSQIVKLSNDKASKLQLFDHSLFYQNENDNNAIYVIDYEKGQRASLLGFTITDGGPQFIPLKEEEQSQYSSLYSSFVNANKEKRSSNSYYPGPLAGNLLLAEVDSEKEVLFYRYKGDSYLPTEVDLIVIVTPTTTILGQYEDGGMAYRQDWLLTLFEKESPIPLFSLLVAGRPPSEIKSGEGDRYGLFLSWQQKALDLWSVINLTPLGFGE